MSIGSNLVVVAICASFAESCRAAGEVSIRFDRKSSQWVIASERPGFESVTGERLMDALMHFAHVNDPERVVARGGDPLPDPDLSAPWE